MPAAPEATPRVPSRGRLEYVDWLRGFAVLLMMQTHAYDAWLAPEAKQTVFFKWSRLAGGYPAPLFLFLAGLSLALLAEARFRNGTAAPAVRRELARRGLEVLVWAALFRLWMFTTGGFAKPVDLLRVDVLNCIGLSMLLVGSLALTARSPRRRTLRTALLGALVAVLTPLAWDLPSPSWIPFWLRGYWSGRAPGAFFPLFPWAGFTAVGATVGLLLGRARQQGREAALVAALASGGAAAIPLALLLDRLPDVYPRYDFWWTSPNYFLVKVGILLLVVGFAYAWSRMPWAAMPSLLRQLGRTSLLVYWVHIEIVYGGIVARGIRGSLSVLEASLALVTLTAAMLLVSLARTRKWRAT
ncbi:MAG TPA: heparan-alpha-glucosaminide N-acetyltransferase domain-containing protein [Vicinamibacteria bacterium]|nr:heparan-alpha-glucosaminide N-acetyltransferase domain-containing protein [Vicinamibacteria bacterium]